MQVQLRSTIATIPILLGSGILAGLVAEILIAGLFGSQPQVGIYRIAISVPALLSFAVGSAFVTAALAELVGTEGEPQKFAGTYHYIKRTNAALVSVVLFLGLATLPLQEHFLILENGGVAQSEIRTQLALSWVMFAFVGSSLHYRAILNAKGVYWLNASVTLVRYGLLASVLGLLHVLGVSTPFTLALAAALAGLGVLLVHAAGFQTSGVKRPTPEVQLTTNEKARLRSSLVSVTAFQIVSSFTTVIDRSFVSKDGPGSVASFDYAITLITAAGSLFASFGAIIILPTILRWRRDSLRSFRTIWPQLAAFLLLALMASLLIVATRTDVIRIIFERGQFLADDTSRSADYLRWYGLGVFLITTNNVFFYFFNALELQRWLLRVAFAKLAIRLLCLSILFRGELTHDLVGKSFASSEVFVAVLMAAIIATKRPLKAQPAAQCTPQS